MIDECELHVPDQAPLALDPEQDEVVLWLPDPLLVLVLKSVARAQAPPACKRVQRAIGRPRIWRVDLGHLPRAKHASFKCEHLFSLVVPRERWPLRDRDPIDQRVNFCSCSIMWPRTSIADTPGSRPC